MQLGTRPGVPNIGLDRGQAPRRRRSGSNQEGGECVEQGWSIGGKREGNGGTSPGGNDAMGIGGWGIPVK